MHFPFYPAFTSGFIIKLLICNTVDFFVRHKYPEKHRKNNFAVILTLTSLALIDLHEKSPLLLIAMNMPLVFSLIFLRPLILSIIIFCFTNSNTMVYVAWLWTVWSYLSNRLQFVQFNGQCSSPQTICCGVPQGSILGPFFFLLYINDLKLTYQRSSSWFYSLMILIYLCPIKILSTWQPHSIPNLINYPLGLRLKKMLCYLSLDRKGIIFQCKYA